jgi:hypothetical protein
VFYTNACAQASKSYSITHIVNKTIDNGEYVNDKRIDKNDKIATSHLIYLLSPKKTALLLQIYGLGGIRKEGAGFIYHYPIEKPIEVFGKKKRFRIVVAYETI